jgi:hypothetical protein
MGGALWLVEGAIPLFTHGLAQAVALAGEIAGALAVYGGLLTLFGATSWPQAVKAVRQSHSRDLRS